MGLSLIIGLFSLVLGFSCVFLILLILIQLPKKEAGLGVAFGASTTEALFGAGSGTVLSRVTRYLAATVMVLSLLLSILWSRESRSTSRGIQRAIEAKGSITTPASPATATPVVSNLPAVGLTPAQPATNTPAEAPAK